MPSFDVRGNIARRNKRDNARGGTMKKTKRILLCMGAVILVAAAFWGGYMCHTAVFKMKEVSAEKARRAVPVIDIGSEEYALIDKLFENPAVLAAMENDTRAVELDVALGEELAGNALPADAQLSSFSVIDENVYLDYTIDSYRVIIKFAEPRDITKTVSYYSKNGRRQYIYENDNNETYKKGCT